MAGTGPEQLEGVQSCSQPRESGKTMELHPEPGAGAGQAWPRVWAAHRAGIKGAKQETGSSSSVGTPGDN